MRASSPRGEREKQEREMKLLIETRTHLCGVRCTGALSRLTPSPKDVPRGPRMLRKNMQVRVRQLCLESVSYVDLERVKACRKKDVYERQGRVRKWVARKNKALPHVHVQEVVVKVERSGSRTPGRPSTLMLTGHKIRRVSAKSAVPDPALVASQDLLEFKLPITSD